MTKPTLLRRTLAISLVILVNVAATLAGLKAYDYYLISTYRPAIPDEDTDDPTMRTMDYYPYTGTHVQAYKRERGSEVLWNHTYNDYDVRSGEYGFFIDFPLEVPPAKAANEIRIILTGASAAQGWGARTNEEMFYKLLPDRLTKDLLEHGLDCKVSVVNLAMGASVIYQNFIALNKWGHDLDPDAIISFSGHNELAVPWNTKDDETGGSQTGAAMQYVLRYSASPQWLKTLAEYFPGIVRRTQFGSWVRYLYFKQYEQDWREGYVVSRLAPHAKPISKEEQRETYQKLTNSMTIIDVVEKISIPMYVHSLESISRDFPNIPVFAVFQPLWSMPEEYRLLKDRVVQAVSSRANPEHIKFYDLSAEWEKQSFYPGSLIDPVHLSNPGHVLVTDYLSQYLLPFVSDRCARLKQK
jgi:lysophospholipase L1-like esterase